MKKRIFSGIQPSGELHIGNYVGAISQWVNIQNSEVGGQRPDAIFCIVDQHAITVRQDPKVLREKIREVAALYIAAGIDPSRSHIFIQSENPDHSYLTWILNCIAPYGQLLRMTQFKEKSLKQQEHTSIGLFDYPVLMASDILLYQTDEVPVGDDQVQHIELTRDLAEKFNSHYREVFKLPHVRLVEAKTRIMSLQDPTSKMSKSDDNSKATIFLLDDTDGVAEKVRRAVTDSGDSIVYGDGKGAVANLLSIYSTVSGESISSLEKKYTGVGYGEFKGDLATAVVEFLRPLQEKYNAIRENEGELDSILDAGAAYARSISSVTLEQARDAVGLGR